MVFLPPCLTSLTEVNLLLKIRESIAVTIFPGQCFFNAVDSDGLTTLLSMLRITVKLEESKFLDMESNPDRTGILYRRIRHIELRKSWLFNV